MTPDQWEHRRKLLGITPRDWARIQALALETTPHRIPAALADLDADYRVQAVPVESRRFSNGRQIGVYRGRAILIWPKY